ncbi:MAG: hypothetical protein KAJ18_11880, partial [Candidatus Omnitrophica bacterium]|nr:hypothetical protein [Candidatus Omnitrophota bacterium]
MDSWKPMFVVFKSLLILNSMLLILQFSGNDQLLNHGLDHISSYGVVGQHMQMGSFSIVLAACLSIIHPAFFIFPVVVGILCNSVWTIFCAFAGIIITAKSNYVRIAAVPILIIAMIICIKSNKIEQALSK